MEYYIREIKARFLSFRRLVPFKHLVFISFIIGEKRFLFVSLATKQHGVEGYRSCPTFLTVIYHNGLGFPYVNGCMIVKTGVSLKGSS